MRTFGEYNTLAENIFKVSDRFTNVYFDYDDDDESVELNMSLYMDNGNDSVIDVYHHDYFIDRGDFKKLTIGQQDEIETLIGEFTKIEETQREVENSINCPLCGAVAEYRQDKDETMHGWVCTECPMVAFEFYDKEDWLRLGDVLNININAEEK